VRADERRLTQILINVIGNAVKFTAAGRVVFRVTHQRGMAHFEVEDTGPGIAAADLERVFEPFARGSAAALSPAGPASSGTGLGLTIAKMLTDLMGGELTVSSRTVDDGLSSNPSANPSANAGVKAGVNAGAIAELSSNAPSGTCFRIRLFLPALDAARLPAAAAPRTAYAGPRRRVLVVDNEEVDRTLLATRLDALGFEVLQAASGPAALALLHEMAVDAILMDLAMPGIDGWQTLRLLRQQALSSAPAAIVSANAFDKGQDNDVGITAADFITKPLRLDELLDWLGRRLGLQWLAEPMVTIAPMAPMAPMATIATNATVATIAPIAPLVSGGTPAALKPPPPEQLQALAELVSLGYVRGVLTLLDEIAAAHPECIAWVAAPRALAQSFQLDRITPMLKPLVEPLVEPLLQPMLQPMLQPLLQPLLPSAAPPSQTHAHSPHASPPHAPRPA